jgi:hypothetical protein
MSFSHAPSIRIDSIRVINDAARQKILQGRLNWVCKKEISRIIEIIVIRITQDSVWVIWSDPMVSL